MRIALLSLALGGVFSLIVVSLASAEENPKPLTNHEQTELAKKVYGLLKDKCYGCHGEPKKTVYGLDGKFDFILDYDKLVDSGEFSRGIVNRGSPSDSKIWSQIEDGEMPRQLDSAGKPKAKAKLTQDEIDLVKKWVDAGVPRWPGAKPWGKPLKWTKESTDHVLAVQIATVAQGPDGSIVALRGDEKSKPLQTFVWDGKAWKDQQAKSGPENTALFFSPGVFDEHRQRTVFLSAGSTTDKIIVWEWDGKVWTSNTLATAPKFRFGATVAFDPATQSVLLFGVPYHSTRRASRPTER